MKFIIVLAIVGVCAAAPQRFTSSQNANEIVITRSENENDGLGNFRWLSETSDGNLHEQSGYLKAGPDPNVPIQVIQGTISYIAPDGQQIQLNYIADENGFQPVGAHIPTLPAQQQVQQRPQQFQARRP